MLPLNSESAHTCDIDKCFSKKIVYLFLVFLSAKIHTFFLYIRKWAETV